MPPARGIIVASSEQHSAPVIVSKPANAQASNSQPCAPLNRDDSADTIKIPEPIIEPMTIMVASIGPRARTRLDGWRWSAFAFTSASIDSVMLSEAKHLRLFLIGRLGKRSEILRFA